MRPSEKLATIIALIIFIVSSAVLYQKAQDKYGTEIPVAGGKINEGIVGYPRFINPLLATSEADKDLTSLIYSGLLKSAPNGELVPDLAESWSISEDGLVYTVKLRPNTSFHDGQPLTAEDVEFTIQKAIDPNIKSPKAANWSGVTIEKIDSRELKFTLKKPYAPFAENLTMGILPKHVWESVSPAEFDLTTYYQAPIGSGPYQLKDITQDSGGVFEYYDLEPFARYVLGRPYISKIRLTFFRSEEDAVNAFKRNDIDTLGGLSPEYAAAIAKTNSDANIHRSTLPRIFGLFFNQTDAPIFLNKEVRRALNESVDREAIIAEVLKGYGTDILSPIPINMNEVALVATTSTSTTNIEPLDLVAHGKKILEDNGWKLSASTSVYEKKTSDKTERLAFTISTSDSPELTRAAELLKDQWTKIGADVKIETFEGTDLTQKVIRPRKYGALLFGQIVGRDIDLYPFWHSSQRVDPGLNIALYANTKANAALDLARSSSDPLKRITARADFAKEIANDIPAVFLFSPEYIYISNKDIHNTDMQSLTEPSDRFININRWYIKTSHTWRK